WRRPAHLNRRPNMQRPPNAERIFAMLDEAEHRAEPIEQPDEVTDPAPVSWSIEAKRGWPALPKHLRDEITQGEREANDYFRQFEGLGKYRKLAAERGTTLAALLHEFITIEQLFRLDPEAGYMRLARKVANQQGIPPQHFREWAGALFADLA